MIDATLSMSCVMCVMHAEKLSGSTCIKFQYRMLVRLIPSEVSADFAVPDIRLYKLPPIQSLA